MSVSIIAAMAANRVIGRANKIPWKIPGEQKLFRKITEGHTIIMGRKTYESIGRPLPFRLNIIITRKKDYIIPDCLTFSDLFSALAEFNGREVFIIGGEQIYKQALPIAEDIYLTIIQKKIAGDVFFPEFSKSEFIIVEEQAMSTSPPYTFIHFKRIPSRARSDTK
ncbi:MAG: dihydrofolate reductase [Desulfobacterales bacterium]